MIGYHHKEVHEIYMDLSSYCKSKIGVYHEEHHIENQDACCSMQENEFCCLCIADGAGSKTHSGVGATWLVRDICHTLIGAAAALFAMSEQEINTFIIERMQRSLQKTADVQQTVVRELSSTLLFVLTDGRRYIIGHLGDGVIIGEREHCWDILSFPQNGTTSKSTFLTTMPAVERHFRIHCMECGNLHRIWLMTDGTMYAAFGANFSLPAGSTLQTVLDGIAMQKTDDDATYGYVAWKE